MTKQPAEILSPSHTRKPAAHSPASRSTTGVPPVSSRPPSPGTPGEGRCEGSFNVQQIRADFPILQTQSHNHPLIYLDNGATTQKPRAVIDAIRHYYESQNANIHRGVYELSQLATTLYENARVKIQKFINARESAEIIFTRGT